MIIVIEIVVVVGGHLFEVGMIERSGIGLVLFVLVCFAAASEFRLSEFRDERFFSESLKTSSCTMQVNQNRQQQNQK